MDLSNALCTFRTGNAKLIIDKREMIDHWTRIHIY